MKEIKLTNEQVCQTREELAKRYFIMFGEGVESVYSKGNMGIVTLLSDLQHAFPNEYWNKVLNDIKCILITDNKSVYNDCDKKVKV